jgi:hypothetical protein
MLKGEPADVSASEPSVYQCVEFIQKISREGDDDERFQALIYALWTMNDMLRVVCDSNYFQTSHITFRHKENGFRILEGLETLIDFNHDGDILLLAEMHRERGYFDESLKTLDCIDDAKLGSAVKTIRALCKRQLAIVSPIINEYG